MASDIRGPHNVEHKSKESGAEDLFKTTIPAITISSEDDLANEPWQTIDLSQSAVTTHNNIQETENQMDNGLKDDSSGVEMDNFHNQKEGLRRNEANKNNNDRNFRKSYSSVTLTLLADKCSACNKAADGLESLTSTELRQEMKKLQQELRRKEEECLKLTHAQLQTSQEVEELTASLFEEANKMVQDAHIKRMATEKSLAEANNRIEVLQAEVTALKTLVLTSTPSEPNPHLNPQIDKTKKEFKGHRRSTSHHNFVQEIQLPRFNLQNEVAAPEKPQQIKEVAILCME